VDQPIIYPINRIINLGEYFPFVQSRKLRDGQIESTIHFGGTPSYHIVLEPFPTRNHFEQFITWCLSPSGKAFWSEIQEDIDSSQRGIDMLMRKRHHAVAEKLLQKHNLICVPGPLLFGFWPHSGTILRDRQTQHEQPETTTT